MKRSLLVLSFLVSVFVASAQLKFAATPEEVGISSEKLKRADSVIMAYLNEEKIAGASALILRHDKVAYEQQFGYANKDTKKPIDETTMFRMCSMTKPITSVAVMQLVDEGKIKVTDPVSNYLPDFKNPNVFVERPNEETGESYTLIPANREITIADLLSHSSGIAYKFSFAVGGPKALAKMYEEAGVIDGIIPYEGTLADNMKKVATLPLLHQPGEKWTYGLNTDILSYLVEVVSGERFDKYLEKHIFSPLGMEDTYFFPPKEKLDRVTKAHEPNWDEGGKVRVLKDGNSVMRDYLNYSPNYHENYGTYFAGGAGLISTPRDYALFCQAMLNDGAYGDKGKRILSEATAKLMHDSTQTELNQTPGYNFGYGFRIATNEKALETPGSYFWSGFFFTEFFIDPTKDMAVILLMQQFPHQHLKIWPEYKKEVYKALVD